MKRLHKQTGITVRLSRAERATLREAAKYQTRLLSRQVTASELLRDGGLAKAAEILATPLPVEPAVSAA